MEVGKNIDNFFLEWYNKDIKIAKGKIR